MKTIGIIVAMEKEFAQLRTLLTHAVTETHYERTFVTGTIGDNRIIMPMSALFGASYIMWADAYARSVHGAAELPLGIVTAFIGAPFFMFLMIKNGYGGGGKK